MDINWQAYKTHDEVRRALEQYLAINRSTVAEAQAFLREQGLQLSPYVPESTFKLINYPSDHLATRDFDGILVTRIPAPSSPIRGSMRERIRAWFYSKIFITQYRIDFHFLNNRLVEILIIREVTGF
jgi:hypothetical protein